MQALLGPYSGVWNYNIPLLCILIRVFYDVDDYLMDLVDGHIIPVLVVEQKIRDDIKEMDGNILFLMQIVHTWKKTDVGKERSRLLTTKK